MRGRCVLKDHAVGTPLETDEARGVLTGWYRSIAVRSLRIVLIRRQESEFGRKAGGMVGERRWGKNWESGGGHSAQSRRSAADRTPPQPVWHAHTHIPRPCAGTWNAFVRGDGRDRARAKRKSMPPHSFAPLSSFLFRLCAL